MEYRSLRDFIERCPRPGAGQKQIIWDVASQESEEGKGNKQNGHTLFQEYWTGLKPAFVRSNRRVRPKDEPNLLK